MAIERISRKDIAKMSPRDLIRVGWEPYRKLLGYLMPYKVRFILGIIFGALFGAVNGLLLMTIRHVSGIVFHDGHAGGAGFLGRGQAASDVELETVIVTCALVPAIMLIRGLFSYLNAYCMLWVSMRVLEDIRGQLFGHIMAQSLDFFNKSKGGELIQTVFNQTRMAQQALMTIASDVVKQPLSILSALAALFWIDWKFTLISLVLFPICIIPVAVVGRKVRKAGAKEEQEAGAIMVIMQEAFAGARVVQAHGRETYEVERFGVASQKMLQMMMRWRKAMEIVGPLVEAFASIGIGMALVYAWYFNLGSAKFLALQAGLVLLYPPIKTLSRIHILVQKCLSAASTIFELLERNPTISNKPGAVELGRTEGRIQFENVSFRYNKTSADAVRKLNLNIEPGKSYALVGESGAGKSTVLSLLLRFYDPYKGRILIDGHDLRDVSLQSLRAQMGIVTQETFLFHDTIANNIRYGRLDATKEEIEAAAKAAFAHDFIMAQPEGYDTVVGDKGCNLSGGQQQRLTIARAILRNAPILLLDEATSALDSESERRIQEALQTFSRGRTVIAIAHRLSTILNSDAIVVMENGTAIDIGPHAELIQRCPVYARLYQLQYQGGVPEEITVMG
jgi:subfamily B ATP-binding cassette protein MsbA